MTTCAAGREGLEAARLVRVQPGDAGELEAVAHEVGHVRRERLEGGHARRQLAHVHEGALHVLVVGERGQEGPGVHAWRLPGCVGSAARAVARLRRRRLVELRGVGLRGLGNAGPLGLSRPQPAPLGVGDAPRPPRPTATGRPARPSTGPGPRPVRITAAGQERNGRTASAPEPPVADREADREEHRAEQERERVEPVALHRAFFSLRGRASRRDRCRRGWIHPRRRSRTSRCRPGRP